MAKPYEHDLQTILDAINGEGRWKSDDPKKSSNSFGNITAIAKRLGVSRPTIYNYINHWKTVKDAIHDAREEKKDFVEDRMFKRIMEGSDVMMIFYAKTQMKDRGYIERQEISGGGKPQEIINYTVDEWRKKQEKQRNQVDEALAEFENE